MTTKQTIESREVAEMIGRQHNELLKDIRKYIGYLAEGEIPHSDFFLKHMYLDANNQERPCFLLTKEGCEMVANKLTGKKGVVFTALYVKKFNEMEQKKPNKPSYMIEDPIKRAELWIEEQLQARYIAEQNEVKDQLIAEYEPKVSYLDTILSSTDTVTITQIAADYGMSARQMNKLLKELGVQHKVSGQWILYKKHMGQGYTKSHTSEITKPDGGVKVVMNTKWKQKGRLFLYNLLKEEGYYPQIEMNLDI